MTPDQTVNGEKTEDPELGQDASETAESSPTTNADDYPAGTTLVFIVVALAMSMFLVALDMVRRQAIKQTWTSIFGHARIVRLIVALKSFCRQLSRQPSPKSPMTSTP